MAVTLVIPTVDRRTQKRPGPQGSVPAVLLSERDPANQKLTNAERLVVLDGRRGLPVTKPRFLPAELAHPLARKLSARRLGTVSAL